METLLPKFDQPFVGHYRDLQKVRLDATAAPGTFGKRAFESARFPKAARFAASIRAPRRAVTEQGATRLDRVLAHVDKQPVEPTGSEWWSFWSELVSLRNAVAHNETYRWTDLGGFYEAMTPLLEHSLSEESCVWVAVAHAGDLPPIGRELSHEVGDWVGGQTV